MSYAAGAKEMLHWLRRDLMAIETYMKEQDRDLSTLREECNGHLTLADAVLCQFLEFTKDCYAIDMTIGSGWEGCVWSRNCRGVPDPYKLLQTVQYEGIGKEGCVGWRSAWGESGESYADLGCGNSLEISTADESSEHVFARHAESRKCLAVGTPFSL